MVVITGAAVTVTGAVALRLPLVAVTTAFPAAAPVSNPEPLTLAVAGSDEFQLTPLRTACLLPSV